MINFRIIAGAALTASLALAGVRGAAAQSSEAAAAPGKPIQLLHFVDKFGKTAKAKSHVSRKHVRTSAKRHSKHAAKRAAKRIAHHTPAPDAPVPTKIPDDVAAAAVPAAALPSGAAQAVAEPTPAVVTVAGQSVRIASPEDVNELDRAADAPNQLARDTEAGTKAATDETAAAPAEPAQADPEPTESASADAAPADATHPAPAPAAALAQAPADQPRAAVATVAASASDDAGSKPGGTSASWIAQALAALGGAVAAASAAWFLIGSVPNRPVDNEA
jgi:hypothetical protein